MSEEKASVSPQPGTQREEEGHEDWTLTEFQKLSTLGTGTFGRVFLVTYPGSNTYYAMKVLQKSVIVRLKQVQHTLNEKEVLVASRDCPFIVTL